jgi:signal recognition particle receptor subunit alpha
VNTKVNSKTMGQLDYSKKNSESRVRSDFIGEDEGSDGEEEVKDSGWINWITNSVQKYTGNKQLTEEDLRPTITTFRQHLMSKNVAEEIANSLCRSISENLLTTKTASFTTIHQTVREALGSSLAKLLTPTREIDVLRDAMAARNREKPYTIVFCGINGVGKSTSLAKIAYHLKTKGDLSLMLAGCDTFRSGAIE